MATSDVRWLYPDDYSTWCVSYWREEVALTPGSVTVVNLYSETIDNALHYVTEYLPYPSSRNGFVSAVERMVVNYGMIFNDDVKRQMFLEFEPVLHIND